QPNASVTSVIGTPTRAYSQNPIGTRSSRAASTTIRLATEPRIVRLPASVDAIASSIQARVGSPKLGTTVLNRSTAGTVATRLDRRAVASVSTAGRDRASRLARPNR